MKRYRTFTVIGLMAALLLSACSQDELAENSTALPEGEYPLQIGSVTLTAEVSEQPWTRVSESPADGMSSVWEGNEQIGVQIGRGQPGIYTVQADGSVDAVNPVYWTSTALTYVTAWYPVEETVNLRDQSDRLAYVLNATQDYVTYEQSVTLNFTHKLAKVRVLLDGSQAEDVTNVEVYNYTKCKHILGTVVTSDTEKGWIKMKKQTFANDTECWEANVVPGEVISQIKVNNTEATLTKPLTPKVAALNTIDLTVGENQIFGGETITKPGEYIVKGTVTESITLDSEDITLILEGADVNTNGIAINIVSGNPTLKIQGTENAVKSTTSTAIHVGSGCTLTIEGVNGIADKLKAEGGKNDGTALGSGNAGAGIGSSNGGNIVISNVTIEATGSTWNHFVSGQYGGGAAIGSTVPGYCGDITITDAVVNATGGYMAAAIGMGGSIPDSYDPDLKIGKIDIRNSVITAKGGDGASAIGFASMSSASLSSAYAGEIYIEMTETSSAFLNRLTISNGNYKIGKGYYYYYTGRMTFYNQDGSGTWPGVTLKASDGTQTSPDGIGQ